MTRRLFWRLCFVIATGVVALFYLINLATSRTELGMSLLKEADRIELTEWGREAEKHYLSGHDNALEDWLTNLQKSENTWASVAYFEVSHVAGGALKPQFFDGYNLGRSVDWKIHLYFDHNPIMEVPFEHRQASFLVQLPERMRPGYYWRHTKITLQIILPSLLMALLGYILYRHIMKPLRQLQVATAQFSRGNLSVSAQQMMGGRKDEFSEVATTFDAMASRIGEQIISQRQLIADLSHELRTPLARLDIAVEAELKQQDDNANIQRVARESGQIKKLVEDTLTLAWLENERPNLNKEEVELVDLLDVLVEDAQYEFPDRRLIVRMPDSALVQNSNHRALAQAVENIIRNACRYTPAQGGVKISLKDAPLEYQICVRDQGPGVPEEYLEAIFKPFFRVDKSRLAGNDSFGLGLALARRQLLAVQATITARNLAPQGLSMCITIPKSPEHDVQTK